MRCAEDRAIVAFIVDRFESRPGSDPLRGFVNDPHDKGRATNWGVTQEALGLTRRLGRNATVEEVKALTREEAVGILLAEYVVRYRFDLIPELRLRFAAVDFGINSGPKNAARQLQRAIGAGLRTDGEIGPKTLAALAAADSERVRARLIGARIRLIGRLVTRAAFQWKFGEGWCDRVATVLEIADHLDLAAA